MREISYFLLIFAEAWKAVGVLKSLWRQGSGIRIGLWAKKGKISILFESNDLCLEVARNPLKKMDKAELEEKLSLREIGNF